MISLGVKHTHNIEEKANGKMELLRTISPFGATSWDEMTTIYILYFYFQESYKSYPNVINVLNLETLADIREVLCLKFTKKCLTDDKLKQLFPKNSKTHPLTRFEEKYKIETANIERLMSSPVICMQRLLSQG